LREEKRKDVKYGEALHPELEILLSFGVREVEHDDVDRPLRQEELMRRVLQRP